MKPSSADIEQRVAQAQKAAEALDFGHQVRAMLQPPKPIRWIMDRLDRQIPIYRDTHHIVKEEERQRRRKRREKAGRYVWP
ncbi:MAG TPA: hypothetical protein ENH55_13350 [Aurantimonas coralicida]|uniref:Uncharacterized protein n=1 Tax=Aurantimonas coralicida TaxID=182270 RepID=A0A9C9NE59_9HYPH|nr:hypothetical protein [Aurantimonas coralicida]HET99653.1 hypothetical protein [Aurantimonas coralicida]